MRCPEYIIYSIEPYLCVFMINAIHDANKALLHRSIHTSPKSYSINYDTGKIKFNDRPYFNDCSVRQNIVILQVLKEQDRLGRP